MSLRLLRRAFSSVPLVLSYKNRVLLEHWINQDGICPLCKKSILNPLTQYNLYTPNSMPTIDHIIPVSRGGKKGIRENGRVVHSICNLIRGNILDEEFNLEYHLSKIETKLK